MNPGDSMIIRVGNFENVSEDRPQDEAHLALTKPGFWGLPHVVLACEAAWLVASRSAKQAGWEGSLQTGERGSAEAAVVIFAREHPVHPAGFLIGSSKTSEGGGIRDRPILIGEVDGEEVAATHAAPSRAPRARKQLLDKLHKLNYIVGLDANLSVWLMKLRYPHKRVRGIGVLVILVPRRYKVSIARKVWIDSDHWAFDVKVTKRRLRRKNK